MRSFSLVIVCAVFGVGASIGCYAQPSTSSGDAPASTADSLGGAEFNTPVQCTSGSSWSDGEGSTMAPGQACISCHSRERGPRYPIAGTVYPTAHEPNDCYAAGTAGAVVTGVDNNNMAFSMTANAAGNFYARGSYTALLHDIKVTYNGVERAMGSEAPTGDCNSCHTESGANGAPGRILLPK